MKQNAANDQWLNPWFHGSAIPPLQLNPHDFNFLLQKAQCFFRDGVIHASAPLMNILPEPRYVAIR